MALLCNFSLTYPSDTLLWVTSSVPFQTLSAQLSSRCYLPTGKTPHSVRGPIFQTFSTRCLVETIPKLVWLHDDDLFTSFFKELCRALPPSAPLSSSWSMVWCPWICIQKVASGVPQQFRSSETQVSSGGCFTRQTIYLPGHFHSLRHVQESTCIHRSLPMWMSNINTYLSGLLIPFLLLFFFSFLFLHFLFYVGTTRWHEIKPMPHFESPKYYN